MLPLLCRLRSFAVSAKVTLTCFFAPVGLAVFVLGTAHGPALAQYPGGGGGYLAHCSGGTVNGIALTPSDSPYPGSSGSATGSASVSASASNGQAGTCKITASDGGAVTGTLTWSGGSANTPAPPAAIIVETSTATWSGTVGDSPDFVFTNDPTAGFGSGVTTVFSQDGNGNKTYTGTKYSVATSGSGATTTCSPNFILSGTTGVNYDSYEYATLRYTYSLQGFPATVTPTGLINVNGTQEALTGQPLTTSVTFDKGLPSGATITNYQWDIESQEGASIVGGYFTSQPLGKTLSVTGLNDPSSSSITFYDGIKDNVTVNATVTVKFADNTTGTLKASTQIAVVKPTVAAPAFRQTEYDNFVQHDNDTSSALGAHEIWSGVKITMPTGFSSGTGCFAQILNSTSRTDTRHTGGTYTQKVQISDGTWTAIPTPCLDTAFPYTYAAQWQVSGTGMGDDQPYFQVAPPLNAGDAGRNDWYHASGEDHFTTWVMFTPNNADSHYIWVPLGSFDWDWSNTADLNVNSLPPGWIHNPPGGHYGTLAANDNWPTWTNFTPSGALAMHQ